MNAMTHPRGQPIYVTVAVFSYKSTFKRDE